MAEFDQLYKEFASISDVKAQTIVGNGTGLSASPSRYQHAVQSWAVAGQNDEDKKWYRYYLVQVDSILETGLGSLFGIPIGIVEYGINLHLVNDAAKILPNTQLVARTPDTTQGATSYTTSLNETFSASGGFFGETPTLTVGYSVSFGHSVTRQIPDITVHNKSLSLDGQNATWILQIARNALAQHDSIAFTTQSLFRVPWEPTDKSQLFLRLDFGVGLEIDPDLSRDMALAALGPTLSHVLEQNVKSMSGDTLTMSQTGWQARLDFSDLLFGLKSPAIPDRPHNAGT